MANCFQKLGADIIEVKSYQLTEPSLFQLVAYNNNSNSVLAWLVALLNYAPSWWQIRAKHCLVP